MVKLGSDTCPWWELFNHVIYKLRSQWLFFQPIFTPSRHLETEERLQASSLPMGPPHLTEQVGVYFEFSRTGWWINCCSSFQFAWQIEKWLFPTFADDFTLGFWGCGHWWSSAWPTGFSSPHCLHLILKSWWSWEKKSGYQTTRVPSAFPSWLLDDGKHVDVVNMLMLNSRCFFVPIRDMVSGSIGLANAATTFLARSCDLNHIGSGVFLWMPFF